MFVGIVLAALIGAVFIQIIVTLEKIVIPWRSGAVRRNKINTEGPTP